MIWDSTWRFGANFYPSTAINQLEMWQKETFDPETIDRELGFAESIGMTLMRIYLHDLAFEQEPEGFLQRLECCLAIAGRHGIKVMPVFFDDCWNSEFSIGRQPAPIPFTHNSGWIQSPGNTVADDPSQWGRLERYVKAVLERFGSDRRVLLWDLYNEPGNGETGDHMEDDRLRIDRSLPLLRKVFCWAREIGPQQPLTAGVWRFSDDFAKINRFLYDQSDVVSFHSYEPPEQLRKTIAAVRAEADGRPVLCSEYMARTAGSTFAGCLPILRQYRIDAVNWGLVNGKSQTIYPWRWNESKGVPEQWFHDVFQPDGSLLYEEECSVFESMSGKAGQPT